MLTKPCGISCCHLNASLTMFADALTACSQSTPCRLDARSIVVRASTCMNVMSAEKAAHLFCASQSFASFTDRSPCCTSLRMLR